MVDLQHLILFSFQHQRHLFDTDYKFHFSFCRLLFTCPVYFCRIEMQRNRHRSQRQQQRPLVTIHEAVRRSDGAALARHLVLNTDVNARDQWGFTALHLATEKGDARLVQILLGMGAYPEMCSTLASGCLPPLVMAATYGYADCLALILSAGVPVNASDRWGNTALLKACSGGHLECTDILLQNGADPTIPNDWGATCLHACVSLGFHDIMTSLLSSRHYDVTADETQSALTTAASKGYHQCVQVLLRAGCPPGGEMRNTEPQTPQALFCALAFCASDNYDNEDNEHFGEKINGAKCVTLLLESGAEVTTMCLELLPEVATQNEGSHVTTVTGVLSAAKLDLSKAERDSIESKVMEQLLLQLDCIPGQKRPPELIDAILNLGYRPPMSVISHLQAQEGMVDRDLLLALQEARVQPSSLQLLCSLAVRSTLQRNVTFATQFLPLPNALKSRF